MASGNFYRRSKTPFPNLLQMVWHVYFTILENLHGLSLVGSSTNRKSMVRCIKWAIIDAPAIFSFHAVETRTCDLGSVTRYQFDISTILWMISEICWIFKSFFYYFCVKINTHFTTYKNCVKIRNRYGETAVWHEWGMIQIFTHTHLFTRPTYYLI